MRGLQLKIAASMALVAGLATLSIGFSTYNSASARLYDEVDRSLVQASAVLIVRNERPGEDLSPRRDRVVLERVVIPQGSSLDMFIISVLDRQGELSRTNSSIELPVDELDRQLAGTLVGDRFRTVVIAGVDFRMRTNSLTFGALQIARPLTETQAVLEDLRRRTFWQVVLISFAAALIGILIARSVVRPLVRLTRAAERVEASGQLDVPAEAAGRDEVGRLTTAFHSMLGALERSRVEQQRLVQNAGHELRTPLTSLRTNLDVMRRHPDLEVETRHRLLDDLGRDTEELISLVNEVIEVASGERDDAEPRAVVLADLVRTAADRLQRRTGRVVSVDADGSVVRARPDALNRAMSNLLDNAHKFDSSGAALRVYVRHGRVEVVDHGPGIPAEDLPHVFERFHRSVDARSLPGSGLGLSIVRDVIEREGGTVFAANHPTGGALVGFELSVDSH
jgi:two-component system, OmpR family, sensor histidine kinase MprB